MVRKEKARANAPAFYITIYFGAGRMLSADIIITSPTGVLLVIIVAYSMKGCLIQT